MITLIFMIFTLTMFIMVLKISKVGGKNVMRNYVADFETTTKLDDCRVWGWGLVDIEDHTRIKVGQDIDEFMRDLEMLHGSKVFFHNLGFDVSFIFDWLLNNGFEYSDKKRNKTFSAIISETNTIYSVEIIYKRYGKSLKKVVLQDSLKKLPYPVSVIAKAYGLEIAKGEIDYTLDRPVGWIITPEEEEYIKLDILVVAQALKYQFEDGLTKMTTGSDALTKFKKSIGTKTFRSCFPILDHETDDYIRKFYKGGFTWVNPKFKGKVLGKGKVYDVNSLYPWVMRTKDLPISEPKTFKGKYKHDEMYPLYLQEIRVDFEVKENHIPTIQLRGSRWSKDTEYISQTNEITTLFLSSVDLKLFMDHHTIHYIEYIGGYKFQSTNGIFNDYIDPLMVVKESTTGAIQQNAKLMLNSLYGKFATNPDVTGKRVDLGDDSVVKYTKLEQEFRDPVYTAMGVFITAYAREKTIRTAQDNIDRFVYADTDSIHLVGSETPNIEIHSTKLGAWDHEYDFIKAKYIRAKMYFDVVMNKDGTIYNVVKGAGIPDNQRKDITLEEYDFGFKYMKLVPKRVKGGIVLVEEEHEVKLPLLKN